ncbi:MAG: DNA polymerase III subunit chi [Paralcaligenes sp.]
MARVDFAFGAQDRLRMACEVTHKHYLASRSLIVYSSDEQMLADFDRQLWSFDPTAFVPHVRANDPLASGTPIWLTAEPPQPLRDNAPATWLLNLDSQCPPGAEGFDRILEIVSDKAEDKQAARLRWRQYQTDGHTLFAHDVSTI